MQKTHPEDSVLVPESVISKGTTREAETVGYILKDLLQGIDLSDCGDWRAGDCLKSGGQVVRKSRLDLSGMWGGGGGKLLSTGRMSWFIREALPLLLRAF